MKKVVYLGFVLEFFALMLFYGYAYPIVPFWGDDFQYMNTYPTLTLSLASDGWIPSRLLPQYIQTSIAHLAAYVIMPLTNLDFLDSIASASALVLSSTFVGFHILLYLCAFILTTHKIKSLLLSSIFMLGCVTLAKSQMMPLLLPADLMAEGMGYLLTMVCFYTLPYLINLGLVVGIFILVLQGKDSLSTQITIRGGAILIIVYLAIFSMESASIILASYAGCILTYRTLLSYKYHKKLLMVFKTYTLFDLCLVLIVILWAVALWKMMHSGRAMYCADFAIIRGITYFHTTLNNIRSGFIQLFGITCILSLLGIYLVKDSRHRLLLITLNLWIICLVIFYILTTSKCGAKWYLMSGLLMAMLVYMVISLSIVATKYKISYIFVSLLFFIACFQTLQPYQERPRKAYNDFKTYSQSWIEQAQQAQQNGQTHVDIYVPDHFGHHRWNNWFAPHFPKTLQTYGILQTNLIVTFKPLSSQSSLSKE